MNGLAVITDPSEIDKLDDVARGQLITQALVESKSWLAVATKGTDPAPIVEFRAWAATVAEATKQRNLAQEIQMDAQEMVRRADRGIGLAIRSGQQAGTIANHGENVSAGKADYPSGKTSPNAFVSPGRAQSDTYAMTDGVTSEQFDDAIDEAKTEGNLSRSNVVRKIKAGKRATPAAPPAATTTMQKRRSLPDQASTAGWDIRKAAERVTRIVADDRLLTNKQKVVAALRNHLLFTADAVAAALEELPEHNCEGG